MSSDDREPYEVGYGKPPKATQIKKGERRNPRGRPAKLVRAVMPRQLRHDIIAAGEKPRRITTPDGEQIVSTKEALDMVLVNKALKGHGPSLRFFLKEYDNAVREHFEENKKSYHGIEGVEQKFLPANASNGEIRAFVQLVNMLRKMTRNY